MDLKSRVKMLPLKEQERFFRQAARFFSNRELVDIISEVQNGKSLYDAHLRAGVFEQYSVDLSKLI